jgi:hypothetical protein
LGKSGKLLADHLFSESFMTLHLTLAVGIKELPSLTRASERYRLASLLREDGFSVRQHSCDYFIRFAGRFVCVLVLFPTSGEAQIYTVGINEVIEKAVERIIRIIKHIAPDIEIKVQPLERTDGK